MKNIQTSIITLFGVSIIIILAILTHPHNKEIPAASYEYLKDMVEYSDNQAVKNKIKEVMEDGKVSYIEYSQIKRIKNESNKETFKQQLQSAIKENP